MRLLLPDRTNTVVTGIAETGQVSKQGYVEHTEHHDGRMDATVHPAAIRVRITSGAPPDVDRVRVVADLEEAQRELNLARAAGGDNEGWVKYAETRCRVALERLGET
jgi:hypothetical protein